MKDNLITKPAKASSKELENNNHKLLLVNNARKPEHISLAKLLLDIDVALAD
jgi:hypothetical protein